MKQILLTCDTEVGELSRDCDLGFEIFTLGKIDGEQVGVPLINKIAAEYRAIVNHFVDVYHPLYEHEFCSLCEDILSNGHFVGLHTHPGSRFRKRYMYEYEIGEQKKILTWGKEWLFKNIGIEVKTHRAGGYGADTETYSALLETGFTQDSSFFYQAKECHMDYAYINRVSCIDKNLWEFPVTIYKESRFLLGQVRHSIFRKLDFRYGSNAETIIEIIRRAPKNSILVLFLHSFNFLHGTYDKRKKKFGKLSVDRRLIEEYHKLLSDIHDMTDTVFTDFSQVYVDDLSDDFLDETQVNISVFDVVKNRLQDQLWGKIPF